MNIQFSTICPQNAKRFLEHSTFDHLNSDQKSLILNNLGSFRVMDPSMYSSGQISCDHEILSLTLIQLGDVEEESFMFNYGHLSLNFTLFKWGIEVKKFKPYKYALDKFVQCGRQDFIDYYLANNFCTKEDIQRHAEFFYKPTHCSVEFLINLYENVLKCKIKYSRDIGKKYSAHELLTLAKKKILSVESLKYSNRDKYNQIIRLKKLNKR